jgi:hypothetical protein
VLSRSRGGCTNNASCACRTRLTHAKRFSDELVASNHVPRRFECVASFVTFGMNIGYDIPIGT